MRSIIVLAPIPEGVFGLSRVAIPAKKRKDAGGLSYYKEGGVLPSMMCAILLWPIPEGVLGIMYFIFYLSHVAIPAKNEGLLFSLRASNVSVEEAAFSIWQSKERYGSTSYH